MGFWKILGDIGDRYYDMEPLPHALTTLGVLSGAVLLTVTVGFSLAEKFADSSYGEALCKKRSNPGYEIDCMRRIREKEEALAAAAKPVEQFDEEIEESISPSSTTHRIYQPSVKYGPISAEP